MWDGLVAAQDAATAACAAFNALFFAGYRRRDRASRVGAAALVLVHGSIALQAAFFLALYLTQSWGGAVEGFFTAPVWLSVRAPMLAAVLFIRLLIVRQRQREGR